MLHRILRKLNRLIRRGGAPATRPPADAAELGPLVALGRVTVFAPHPDDESLGCGGLIARLKDEGSLVHVVVMSDGSASNPNSRRYPGPKLAALRQTEARCRGAGRHTPNARSRARSPVWRNVMIR